MKNKSQLTRLSGLLVLGIAAAEVIIMSSPFAGFFYSSFGFQRFQGFLSDHAATAWLTSFFLHSTAVSTSKLLEWNRELGLLLIAVGLWGFIISAAQVYGNKLLRRGVATGLLYRVSRHPQYLSLAVAGWGMVISYPRFLFLGFWVTMLFLYAGLARFEEKRMAERFGDEYVTFKESRSYFLPGSPVRRLFEASFAKLKPRAVGWISAYVSCLLLAFGLAFALRQFTVSHLTFHEIPERNVLALSIWPTDTESMERVLDPVLEQFGTGIEIDTGQPIYITIMPRSYRQKAAYYRLGRRNSRFATMDGLTWKNLRRLVHVFLLPTSGYTWGKEPFVGRRPRGLEAVHVVVATAEKPFREGLLLDEVLDPGVRTTPVAVTNVHPASGEIRRLRRTAPSSAWGPEVVMPMF